MDLETTSSDPGTVVDSEICPGTSQIATDVTRAVIAVIAWYVLTVEWIHYCRTTGCQNARNHLKRLIETILISVASTFTSVAAVGSIVHVNVLLSSSSQIESIPWGEIRGFLYATSLIVCYSVLWFRQRTIYSNPNLRHLTNSTSRIISKYSLSFIVLSGLVLVCSIVALKLLGTCPSECYTAFLWVSLTIFPLATQLILITLMVHPLYKHHHTNQMCNPKLVTLMKRAAIFTAICLISDMVNLALHLTICVRWKLPLELNMIINVMCVALIPCNWRERFLPCSRNISQDSRSSLEHGTSQSSQNVNVTQSVHTQNSTLPTEFHTDVTNNEQARGISKL